MRDNHVIKRGVNLKFFVQVFNTGENVSFSFLEIRETKIYFFGKFDVI